MSTTDEQRLSPKEADMDITEARRRLQYEPETGHMRWRTGKRAGLMAGAVDHSRGGYIRIGFQGHSFEGHRLAWFLHYGAWPTGVVDHINGVRGDNRLDNMRDITRALNQQNMRLSTRVSRLGFLGVHEKQPGRFVAQIYVDGKTRFIGGYKTPELAHAAYIEVKRLLHPGCTL